MNKDAIFFFWLRDFIIRELFASFLQRETWDWVHSKSRSIENGNKNGLYVKAEMFGQLTGGLEAAWSKLRGVGTSHLTTLLMSVFLSWFISLMIMMQRSNNLS